MNIFIKVFSILMLSPIFIYASTADDVFADITLWWNSFFDVVNSFKWVFGILPVVVVGFAIFSAREKALLDSEKGGVGAVPKIEILGREIKYVIVAIISLYIIYGTFGKIYTDAAHFTDTWKILVIDFWKGVFGIS